MAPDQRFVVMMPSAQRGWIAWRDGKPAHVICGLYPRSFDPRATAGRIPALYEPRLPVRRRQRGHVPLVILGRSLRV